VHHLWAVLPKAIWGGFALAICRPEPSPPSATIGYKRDSDRLGPAAGGRYLDRPTVYMKNRHAGSANGTGEPVDLAAMLLKTSEGATKKAFS